MKYFFVDCRITQTEFNNLSKYGIVIKCPPCHKLYEAIKCHPDILMNIISKNKIIFHKDIPDSFINSISHINLEILYTKNPLTEKYPYDIILNSVHLGNIFIHNLQYTDENLLNFVKTKKLLNVKQGYTKCSTAIIKANAIITSDTSIAEAVKKENIDVLLLSPGHIDLPGLNYGFIGGTCGLIDKNVIGFYGELDNYKYSNEVKTFLEKHNVSYVNLGKGSLIDRGSILSIEN
ncbi:hypothetical protein SH2C18_43600 [Clostridium sediminicola]|uniref:DUF6873 family GME fold protein n=1 Tax=Clostridium sediminicola TaxID=3114879 RepID=UPI0031F1CD32